LWLLLISCGDLGCSSPFSIPMAQIYCTLLLLLTHIYCTLLLPRIYCMLPLLSVIRTILLLPITNPA
jgi:hypothetical protein